MDDPDVVLRRHPNAARRRRFAIALAIAGILGVASFSPGEARKPRRDPPERRPPATYGIARMGEFALVARDGGLDVYEVAALSDPAGPGTPVATASLASSVYDVVPWTETTAFVAAGSDGVVLVDLGDAEAPAPIHRVETRGSARRLGRSGDHLYVADEIGGLVVIDATRPDRARVRRTVPTRSQIRSLTVLGDRLATAEGAAGVRVFDISRPDVPREIATVERRDSAADVLLRGGVLWVADGRRGLRAYVDDGRNGWRRSDTPIPDRRVRSLSPFGDAGVLASLADGRMVGFDLAEDGRAALTTTIVLPRSIPAGRATPSDVEDVWWIAADVAGVALVDLGDRSTPRVLRPRERAFEIRWADGP